MLGNILERIQWGMTRSDVIKKLSDATFSKPDPLKNRHAFIFQSAAPPLMAVAFFDATRNDKLFRIQLMIFETDEPLSDEMLLSLFETMKQELLVKYGKPPHLIENISVINRAMAQSTVVPRGSAFSDGACWSLSDSILTLTLSLRRDGAIQPGICVGYGDINHDPLSKSWAWIKENRGTENPTRENK